MKKISSKQFIGLFVIILILFSVRGSIAQSLMPCNIDAVDQEGNSFSFSLTQTTPGIVIDPSTGIITGSSAIVGSHVIEVVATDEYGAISDPYAYTLIVDSYCGDNGIQTPNTEGQGGPLNNGVEECDGLNGIAFTPADSGPNKTYACSGPCISGTDCTGTCTFLDATNGGGYCGDGVVQTTFGEACDPMETKSDYEMRTGTSISDIGYEVIKRSCSSSCQNNCIGDSDLARGCYLDTNGNGVIDAGECQKGLFICGNTGNLECFDIYTNINGVPAFDYCCSGESIKLECANGNTSPTCSGVPDIGPFTVVRASAMDVILTADHYGGFYGVYANTSTYFYYYTCDYVCKQTDKVCIGVGLNNHETMSCTSVIHDMGGNCLNSGNTVYDDCKSYFSLAGSSTASYTNGYIFNGYLGTCSDQSSIAGLSPQFHVGEAACYCQ